MTSRVVLGVALAALMLVTGPMTYIYLGSRTSKIAVAPEKPTAATPAAQAFSMPGTLYLEQEGALYRLSAGRFHQITPQGGWTQPSLAPDGDLLVVKRSAYYSDVYRMNPFGTVTKRITNNSAPRGADTKNYNWAFYPRLSADGRTIWLAYDKPKYSYDVVLSIWAMPANGTIGQGRLWTNAADYTGGDVQPIPVKGGVIYTKYDYASRYDPNAQTKLVGMLWFTNAAFSVGRQLTTPGEDCRDPSMSPDGTQVAMICTYLKQESFLTIASWNGSRLGKRITIISKQVVAQPTWAPDGSGIAYFAPGTAGGPFQLWWLPREAYAPSPTPVPSPTGGGAAGSPSPSPSPATPVKPVQVTTNSGFDATSPMAWAPGF
jgi:hypothetical protein